MQLVFHQNILIQYIFAANCATASSSRVDPNKVCWYDPNKLCSKGHQSGVNDQGDARSGMLLQQPPAHTQHLARQVGAKSLNSPHAKHPKSWWCNPKSTAISNSPEKKTPRQNQLISDTVFLHVYIEIYFSSCIHLNPLSCFPSDLANFLQNLEGDEITVPSEGRNVLHESSWIHELYIFTSWLPPGMESNWNIELLLAFLIPKIKNSLPFRSYMCKAITIWKQWLWPDLFPKLPIQGTVTSTLVRIFDRSQVPIIAKTFQVIRPLFGGWIWTAEGWIPNSVLKTSILCQYWTEKHQHKQTNSSCLLRICHTRKMNLENTRNPTRTGFLHHAGLQVLNWHSSPEHSKKTQLKCRILMEFEFERWTFDFESFDATTKSLSNLFFFWGGHSMQNRHSMPTKSPKFDLEWLPAGHMVPTWNPSTLNKKLVTWLSYNSTVIS